MSWFCRNGVVDRQMRADRQLEQIIGSAAEVIGASHGYVCLLAPDGDHLVVRAGVGAGAGSVGRKLRRGEGLAGRVWESGRPLLVADYATWPHRVEELHEPIGAAVGVPLRATAGGAVLGVIGVAGDAPDRVFGEAEVKRLSRFAELAALAIESGRRYAAAERELAERADTEERLRQAEARYRALVEQIPAMVYSEAFQLGGARTYVNRSVETMFGYTQEEAAGADARKAHLHPDDREQVLAEEARCERTGEPFRMEYRILHKSGATRWVRDECVLLRDAHGKPLFWQGVTFDITESKQAEQRIRQALEVERAATRRLRALDELKNTFLDAVSHELRTPLAAVIGIALTLKRSGADLAEVDAVDLVGRLVANARKLDKLLNDLLDLDRLSRGILAPKRAPTDLGVLVERVTAEWRKLYDRAVEVQVEAPPVVVSIDAEKVERIVENLLGNAARHTSDGTPVWVRVWREGDGALLAVEDAGSGVDPSLRDTIFEPFRQGPGRASHAPGVGIGLSLVARFAELHGGRAWVTDRAGGGASFRVFLPEADGEQDAAGVPVPGAGAGLG
jgi:PAS domain S-box-containing protein